MSFIYHIPLLQSTCGQPKGFLDVFDRPHYVVFGAYFFEPPLEFDLSIALNAVRSLDLKADEISVGSDDNSDIRTAGRSSGAKSRNTASNSNRYRQYVLSPIE